MALKEVPPVAIILSLTGMAIWAEGFYFVRLKDEPKAQPAGGEPGSQGAGQPGAWLRGSPSAEAGSVAVDPPRTSILKEPIRGVGMVMLIAGLSDMIQMIYIITTKPLATPHTVVLTGMLAFPCGWFFYLGITQVFGLDMKPVANAAIPVAIVPLFWWKFFSDSHMIQADLIIWGLGFISVTFHTYRKISNQVLGVWLIIVAIIAFFLQPVMWALGHALP